MHHAVVRYAAANEPLPLKKLIIVINHRLITRVEKMSLFRKFGGKILQKSHCKMFLIINEVV